jgi:hypothetical protein
MSSYSGSKVFMRRMRCPTHDAENISPLILTQLNIQVLFNNHNQREEI